jgi:uncharacterized repeat protein (TIGR01451 family)
MKIHLFVLFIAMTLLSVGTTMVAPASAATYNITAGSSSAQMQSTLDQAGNGDTINFQPGIYNGIDLVINKTLNLVGNGAIINGFNSTDNIFTVTSNGTADGSGTMIMGFQFFPVNNATNGSKSSSIDLNQVSNVVIMNVTSKNGNAAVYNGNAYNTLIQNCTFGDAYDYAYSVDIMGGNNITITNSSISGSMDGISMATGATNVNVYNNLLLNNTFSAFYGGGISNITFTNNTFNGFYEGLGIEKAANQTFIINNTFENGWGNSTALRASGDAIYIKNSNAHGPVTLISDIQIIGNTFKNIIGAAVGIDNIGSQGIFNASNTGNSISGTNNSVTNVSLGYVVLHSQGQDLNFTMDTGVPQAQPTVANVSLSSSTDPTVIKNGDKTTYTVTVKNTGNGNATNVLVKNILNNVYYSSQASYSSIGTYSNGTWNIGNLSAGNTASLVITATALKSGVTTSQANLTADNNITATANQITKTINKYVVLSNSSAVSSSSVKVGNLVNLYTKISNTGKDTSDNITVQMILPKGMTETNRNNAQNYNKSTNTWTIKMAAGKSYTFTTTAKVTTKGNHKVTFKVNGVTTTKNITGT